MRTILPIVVGAFLIAGTAAAQYKTPSAPAPGQTPKGVQMAPNPMVQITPASPDDELSTARRIERDEAMKLAKEKKAIFIDVRSKEAYDEGHIPGALSIPLSELIGKLKELPPHEFLIPYCA